MSVPVVKQTPYDIAAIRADFPSLSCTANGKPVVFLDTAASALKPGAVIEAMAERMGGEYANIHRGVYAFSASATQAFEDARKTVADFINAPHENTVVFTRNATEGVNLVAHSWGQRFLKAGDTVLITAMEHHANIVPWHMLRERMGIRLSVVDITDDGALDLHDFQTKIQDPSVKLLSFVAQSNALGTINPVKDMVAEARKHGVTTLVDACQSVMHGITDVRDWDADFVVFSGHKLYGPTGIGVLYGREDILNAMPPYQGGGDMIDRVAFDAITYKPAPARFEAGTPAIIEAIGLAAAIDYLNAIGMDTIAAHERAVYDYLNTQMSGVDGFRLIGRAPQRGGVVSFIMDGAHPQDVAVLLDKQGVAVRVGHHCAEPLMHRLGVDGTIRASIGLYTSHADVDAFVTALKKAREFF